ncbi:hypothetical protein ACO0LM_12325 [Undibacterium sp. Di26W]|uniref:hypothetical protein n=1 Tax=Undibacterium sp. Di26W TaxID=3413035 RepID=UPI003BEFA6D5
MHQYINEELRKCVGLEALYAFKAVDNLKNEFTDGIIHGAFRRTTGEIFLNTRLGATPRRAVATYLHEVGHLLAYESCMSTSPNADAHNPYFGVLVAVMYRRANLLEYLEIYDFCDTSVGQRANHLDQMAEDEELIARFTYILRRSARLAKLELSMELLAAKLYYEDYEQHKKTGIFPIPPDLTKDLPWLKIGIVFSALTGLAAATGAIAAAIFP